MNWEFRSMLSTCPDTSIRSVKRTFTCLFFWVWIPAAWSSGVRSAGPPRPGTHVTSMLSCSVFLNVFLPSLKIRILETQRIISVLKCSAARYRLHINHNLSPPLGLQSDRFFPGKFGILAKAEQPKFCLLLRMKQKSGFLTSLPSQDNQRLRTVHSV